MYCVVHFLLLAFEDNEVVADLIALKYMLHTRLMTCCVELIDSTLNLLTRFYICLNLKPSLFIQSSEKLLLFTSLVIPFLMASSSKVTPQPINIKHCAV